MPTTEPEFPTTIQLRRRLERARDNGGQLYALMDGARIDGLWKMLAKLELPHKCLFRPSPREDLRDFAPYLVALDPQGDLPLLLTMMETAFEATLFVLADADMEPLFQHFRRFFLVKDHEGREVYFRFYDPRVLAPFLAASTDDENQVFFGPVRFFFTWNRPASQEKQEVILRGWARPAASGAAPLPPGAASKFRLSRRHGDAFADEAMRSYDTRLAAHLRDTYGYKLAKTTDEDVKGIVEQAKKLGPELGLTAGAHVSTLAELLVIGFNEAERAKLRALPLKDRPQAATALRDKLFPEAFV